MSYFFCGIGGSGMMPLALIVKARGEAVEGSDRALDQGMSPAKFDALKDAGVPLHPQDGSGLVSAEQVLVISTAVEDTVADVVKAKELGCKIIKRAELLAELFNAAPMSAAVAGTSGKSTTTAMIAWILHAAGKDPTVVNGAVMTNFATPAAPFASALVGESDIFVAEADESDGSIANYQPTIAVLNNIARDHKEITELRQLFTDFLLKARTVVINRDNQESGTLATGLPARTTMTYSVKTPGAALWAQNIEPTAEGVNFEFVERLSQRIFGVRLKMPGEHNVSNALAALGTAWALGVSLDQGARALSDFQGVKRRLEVVGTANDVTVIDDFAHNPDKIAATLKTLHQTPGRLLVFFQPHGFGPLRMMFAALVAVFKEQLAAEDRLIVSAPVYFGGSVEKTLSNHELVEDIVKGGCQAEAIDERAACGERLLELAQAGDRIVVMGARDDTLSLFAADLLARVGEKADAE